MTNKDTILNIAVNLGRIGKFAMEGRTKRIDTFFSDNDQYIISLQSSQLSPSFERTKNTFLFEYEKLKQNQNKNDAWVESMFTWQNILTHRAKIA